MLSKSGKVSVNYETLHHPFYSSNHPFFSSLSPDSQAVVKKLGGSSGFGNIQGSIYFSHMYPDNLLEFFGPKFGGGVLHLPGP